MAFTVEDGTGLSDANSYTTVAFFRAYHTDRGVSGVDVGTLDDDAVEVLLVKATDFMERQFGNRYLGRVLLGTQGLSFPREGLRDGRGNLLDVDEVPEKIQQACAEYALRANSDALAPDPTVDATGMTVVSKHEKVGPIEQSFTFAGGGGQGLSANKYPMADSLVAPFLRPKGVMRN